MRPYQMTPTVAKAINSLYKREAVVGTTNDYEAAECFMSVTIAFLDCLGPRFKPFTQFLNIKPIRLNQDELMALHVYNKLREGDGIPTNELNVAIAVFTDVERTLVNMGEYFNFAWFSIQEDLRTLNDFKRARG